MMNLTLALTPYADTNSCRFVVLTGLQTTGYTGASSAAMRWKMRVLATW